MKKTMNINLAGQLFRIDEEAYQILSRYLRHVSAKFRNEAGGEETIADIENRIAEIFGGGKEPPLLISTEMVQGMIETMGAPEEYYDESSTIPAGSRKSLYDPNALLARTGRALSSFWDALARILSAVLRILAVALGLFFTVTGFLLLFLFVLFFFFNDASFMTAMIEPELVNLPLLLSIVLGEQLVQTVCLLAAAVILIPLASLSYLGIKLIFRIGASPKLLRIVLFVTWVASLCALTILLTLQFARYGSHDKVGEKVSLSPPPKLLWIAPLRKAAENGHDEKAVVDLFTFWRKSSTGQLFGTPELSIYGSDTSLAWISIEKSARSKSYDEAWKNARAIDFSWKISRDTLYLDEYFSLPAGYPWNGSTVDIDLSLPEGTEVRPVRSTNLSAWLFRWHDPGVTRFRIKEGYPQELEE
jgi:hypothetical protein